MVACLTGIQYLHVLAFQRSLTVARPSQAFHDDAICEYRVMFAIFRQLRIIGHVCTETGSRRGVNDTWARRRQ